LGNLRPSDIILRRAYVQWRQLPAGEARNEAQQTIALTPATTLRGLLLKTELALALARVPPQGVPPPDTDPPARVLSELVADLRAMIAKGGENLA
jgi:hypothetical protein